MKIRILRSAIESPEISRLESSTGEELKRCYQCGKCSAGCPMSYAMELQPSRIMRSLQLGMLGEAIAANTMWVCTGCMQCHARCPQGCSVASVLEGLRRMVLRKGEDEGRGNVNVKDVPSAFLKDAPQQAIVCGFRKLVS